MTIKDVCLKHEWNKYGTDRKKMPRFRCKRCGVTRVGDLQIRRERSNGISDKAYLEILEYFAQGFSYRELAKLGICSKGTIENIVKSLKEEIAFYSEAHLTDDPLEIARGLLLDLRIVYRLC